MAKKVSIFLVTLMVLTLFAAVAIAAVNGAICDECNNGEVRLLRTAGPYTGDSYNVRCSHGYANAYDTVTERYCIYYYGCNNCSYSFSVEGVVGTSVACHGGGMGQLD